MTTPRKSASALCILGLLIAALLGAGASTAGAVTGGPASPETLPAASSPMWQTSDSVWALAYSNHVLFAAGNFTAICPPGTAAGNCVPTAAGTAMTRIAAFHADGTDAGSPCTTASPCPGIGAWSDPKVNGTVYALTVTPDGSKLYAGGDFTSVKGVNRSHAAGFDLTKAGSPVFTFNPSLNGQVRALAATDTTLYIGGLFTNSGHAKLASYDITGTAGGALRAAWAPTVDNNVFALMIGPGADSGYVVLGGKFRTVNGASRNGIAQLSQTDASNGPMSNTILPTPNGTKTSDVKVLTTDGTNILLGAEGNGYGVFDGTASVNPASGNANWKTTCLGATQALAVIGNDLYIGSHSHNCSTAPGGGFGQLPFNGDPRSWHHLIAERVQADSNGAAGSLRSWFPTVDNGAPASDPYNQTFLGPRAMATDGTSLFVGGEFLTTTENGVKKPQRGLIRYSPTADTTKPQATRPTYTATNPPTATSPAPGQVTLRFPGFTDPDDRALSYSVTRDGLPLLGRTSPDTSSPVNSPFWQSPEYVYRDTAALPGSHTYTVTATDSEGQSASASDTVTTATTATGGYRSAVLADNPGFYWRLDEGSGTAAVDSSVNHRNGLYRGTPPMNRPGAIGSDTAIGISPTRGVTMAPGTASAPPTDYTLEAWVRTDPGASGGRILGWTSTSAGTSASGNRAIYMMNNGQLIYSILTSDGSTCHFGIPYGTPGTCYVWSKQSYNDGSWHHVVATQSSTAGMVLYVDGVKVNASTEASSMKPKTGTGLWQAGYISTFTKAPWGPVATTSLTGDVDEVAVYPTVLSPARITAHWQAAE